jgi:4-amino-4-deoxy-L-arabinose transferase-like glycosyltransferase
MDEEYNLEWARSIATGVWNAPYDQIQSQPYFRAPLYSYFLAGLLWLFGSSTAWVRIVQIVLGSVSCAMVYGVAAKCLGQRIGIVAGILCACYWVMAYFDTQFLLPVLLVFLLLLGLLLLLTAVEQRHVYLAGSAGLVYGLYSITRPNIMLFFPFVIWWVVRFVKGREWRARSLFVGALVLGMLVPPAVVTVRNGVVSGDWVVIASQGGVNFFIGNNPESNGMQAVVPGTRQTWWGGYEDTRTIAEQALGRSLKASEVSDYWFERAFEYIRERPGQWLGLTLRKVIALIGDPELPNNEPYEANRAGYWSLRAIPLRFSVLLGLFLVSLPILLRRSRLNPLQRADKKMDLHRRFVSLMLQFAAVYSLTIIAFFVTGRYRVPLLPIFAIGAATTIVTLFDLIKSRRLSQALGLGAACVLLIGVMSIDFLGVRKATSGFARLSQAQDRLVTGDIEGAIRLLEEIRKDSDVQAPEVYISLARAYVERGSAEARNQALRVAEEGLRTYPDEAELLWYAAVGNVSEAGWESADRYIERYLSLKPDDIRALHLAFVISLNLGRIDKARETLARVEGLDPDHPLVTAMRSRLATLSGN